MSLAGVRGHRAVIDQLWRELARRPAQAYLFVGRSGIGKALVAAGVAHSILCDRAPGPEFCCTPANCPVRTPPPSRSRAGAPAPRCACCDACVQVAAGLHPDFSHVARAENRTDVLIEQVRDLINSLGVRPARGPRRIALIDDAETLNLPAQNALLKTLEEPPGHTLLILVCANERALLDTVRSRLRPVRFAALPIDAIADLLISRGMAPAAARATARLARGSVGRALALLDDESQAPPEAQLIQTLDEVATMDFGRIQAFAQEFFGARERAAGNFELIACLLQEMVFSKLTDDGTSREPPAATPAVARLEPAILAKLAYDAVVAHAAIDSMATARVQAENWWLQAREAMRGNR